MYDKILIPTDGSDGTDEVAEHAAELAKCHDAEVHLLYVVDARAYTVIPEESAEGVREAVAEQGEEVLDNFSTLEVFDTTETVKVLSEGIPHEVITQYAVDKEMDAIVMGTHGRTGPERQALGSVSERVVRFAPIPVVVVPLGMNEEDGETEYIRGFQ